MDYDLIVSHLGETGRYHLLIHGLLWLYSMCSGVMILVYSFAGSKVHYGFIVSRHFRPGLEPEAFRCKIDGCDLGPNSPFDAAGGGRDQIFPYDEDDDDDRDYCKHFPVRVSSHLKYVKYIALN